MYQFDSRVRYSELDESGNLSLTGLVNYLQDCTLFQSEAGGSGIRWLAEKDRVWMLSGWQIDIFRMPRYMEEIRVITRPYAFRKIFGYRSFEVKDASGKVLVFANSVWCYVQASTMRPAPLTAEDMAPYEPLDEPPAQFAERKVEVPFPGTPQEAVVVRRELLDTNHHVNNGQYVNLAADYLPEGYEIGRIRVEYKNQALLGDTIVPEVSASDGQVVVRLGDGEKKTYAVVAFESTAGICR